MKQFKYISNLSEEELNKYIVHACINEDGNRCILIKNLVNKSVVSKYDTDNLEIRLNTVLHYDDIEYYFHVITAKKNDLESNKGFELVYDYIFKKIQNPVLDSELAGLILSIEEYFRITPERSNRTLQTGVWGELFCIKWLYEHGCSEILQKYHNNFFLKHDVELSKDLRMEIKTSLDQTRIHHFRHDQICRKDISILVASLIVEEAMQGTSLFTLFAQILDLIADFEDRFALQKIMKMCGVDQNNQGLSFTEKKAGDDIRFYDACSLPKLVIEMPQGVSKVEYNVDCAMGTPLDVDSLIYMINNTDG